MLTGEQPRAVSQTLEAQTAELLAFREEVLSSLVELQEGLDRAARGAGDAARRADAAAVGVEALTGLGPQLAELQEQVGRSRRGC